ncbi:MAG: DNA mismatch repair endonuclease MutL [Muribaculaceae bacterium]|nr:DNA mismatch repair endonuclease MutL [Muribaculaceae bacterium]
MSDVIKLLPDSVANQIAAGEVIQRPASVIKELVENAVDAQATSIQIILKDAGRTFIQIVDNGVGMSDTDARLAFERHSTSKIRNADDLFSLSTMGFRGEALASIAAISQVELRTRRHDAQLGTRLLLNASTCENQEPYLCAPGSNFIIKNIFFNVPARRKFLKSNQVELSNIIKEFEKLALVNNEIEFTLVHNDHLMYKLSPGSFLQRITALMGKNLEEQLLPVDIDTSLVKISGYVGRPQSARKRNAFQFLFANERYMRHPYFHKAILTCYDQLIPQDEQPIYFLKFTVSPDSIDVNIHPTKTEIKFENEQPIWQILAAGVRETLGRFSESPSIDFDVQDAPSIPAFAADRNVRPPEAGTTKGYNPFAQPHKVKTVTQNWEELYKNFERNKRFGADENNMTESITEQTIPSAIEPTLIEADDVRDDYLQIKGRYIISPVMSGMMIIDQHRAHVRILYDQYVSQMTQQSITSQAILFPEVIHLSKAQSVILCSILPEIEKMGFSIAQMSGDDWSVTSIPAGLENVKVVDLILQLIESVEQGGASVRERVMEHLSLKVAEKAAIPYGRSLKSDEMQRLVADLMRLPNPNYTPDGKTVIVLMSQEQLSRLF